MTRNNLESWGGNMIRIAVVEDEQIYIDQIVGYLRRYEEEEKEEIHITVYRDGDGITAQYKAQFDIIFMDIQMKFVDGMTTAEEIRKADTEVIIIFITNMTQYAIRGYQVDALDYVLKPVTYFAFSQKLKKAITRLGRRQHGYITIAVKGGVVRTNVEDIYYVEIRGHNLIYHTVSENYVSYGTMKAAEEELEPFGFCRGNNCYLINLKHVDGIRNKCVVIRGEELQLSRPRINAFMQALTRHWGDME